MKLLVIFATMTGNAESAAHDIAARLNKAGHSCEVENIASLPVVELATERRPVIVCASTWGDGDPPDEAEDFWEEVQALSPMALSGLRYALYALGDRCYDDFCAFGRKLDECLAARGGKRLIERVESDIDFESQLEPFCRDVNFALQRLAAAELPRFII